MLDRRCPCLCLLSCRLFLGVRGEKREGKGKEIRIILVDITGLTAQAEMDEEAG